MHKQHTLGKSERLKSRKKVETLFKRGRYFLISPFKIYYLMEAPGPANRDNLQVAVGVSARVFRKAVDRNRIKRLTREAFRLEKGKLVDNLSRLHRQCAVFFVFTGKEIPPFEEVRASVSRALAKLEVLSNENNS